jgi:hypothetical protein
MEVVSFLSRLLDGDEEKKNPWLSQDSNPVRPARS